MRGKSRKRIFVSVALSLGFVAAAFFLISRIPSKVEVLSTSTPTPLSSPLRTPLPKPTPSPSPSPSPIPLREIPPVIKAMYFTSWSAGTPARVTYAINLAKSTELNAIVIDVKDFTGKVAFNTESPLIKKIGSEENRVGNFTSLINRFHQEGIYVIARIVMFEDPHLVSVRPDLSVRDREGNIWKTRQGLAWVDPSSEEVWRYNVEVAKEAIRAGVDEVNFDYIRFPSDGDLLNIRYPLFDETKELKQNAIGRCFAYLSRELRPLGKKLSVDLFGLSTVNSDDLGVGQRIEDAFRYFDYVAPMVYPSHYASGFLGYKNPASYPYEVIYYSLSTAVHRRNFLIQSLATSTGTSTPFVSPAPPPEVAEIRPWLQVFDLGAIYTPEMIRKEIQAAYDAGLTSGWYLWNPANTYPTAALSRE